MFLRIDWKLRSGNFIDSYISQIFVDFQRLGSPRCFAQVAFKSVWQGIISVGICRRCSLDDYCGISIGMICSDVWQLNTTSDISKLFYIISQAVWWVKFGAILKYHECYLCQISRTIMLLLVYTTTWEIQSSNANCLFSSSCFAS